MKRSLVMGLLATVFAGCAVPKQYTVHNMPAAGDHNVCLRDADEADWWGVSDWYGIYPALDALNKEKT